MWKRSERRKTVDCQQVEAALMTYLKDGLSPTRRQAIEDHLAACDACTRSVQQAQVLESELRIQAAHHDPILSVKASARIRERVYKRMRRGLIMQRAVKVVGVAVAVVAIALLAVGAMALWQGTPSDVAGEQDVAPESGEDTPTFVPATSTPIPPTDTPGPTSCEEVEGNCLELTWDGESCTYEGPTELKTGPVTFLFRNESEEPAWTNLARHLGDETIQDMIDYNSQEGPTPRFIPKWAGDYGTSYGWAYPGRRHIWEGILKPGIHTMMCGTDPPFGVWTGGGLTVED